MENDRLKLAPNVEETAVNADAVPHKVPRRAMLFRTSLGLLAAVKHAEFPPVCVITNQPAECEISFRYAWPEQLLIRLLILFFTLWLAFVNLPGSLTLYTVFMGGLQIIALTMGWTLTIPLTLKVWHGHQRRVLLCMSAFVLLFAAIPISFFYYTVELRVIGVFAFMILALQCNKSCALLNMASMDGQYVYLKGAHPAYLAALPEIKGVSIFKAEPHDPAPGVWRLFNLLVVRRGMALPPRCLLTNQPTTRVLRMRYVSPNAPSILLLLLAMVCLNICGAILVALVLLTLKRVDLKLPFSEVKMQERRRNILLYMTGFTLAAAVVVPLLWVADGLGAAISMLIALGASCVCPRSPVQVDRVEGDFVMLKGVCPEYLKSLPPF